MKRREFITLLGGAAVAWPLAARAQQGERMRRIGVLIGGAVDADDPDAKANIAAFLQVLQQLGWTDGRNVRIDYRWGAGNANKDAFSALKRVMILYDPTMGVSGLTDAQCPIRRRFRPGRRSRCQRPGGDGFALLEFSSKTVDRISGSTSLSLDLGDGRIR